jgi:hypothetical protein
MRAFCMRQVGRVFNVSAAEETELITPIPSGSDSPVAGRLTRGLATGLMAFGPSPAPVPRIPIVNTTHLPCRLLGIALLAGASALSAEASAPIDRHAVVARHNVQVDKVDPWSPLSVGNGDFAFTMDATGLQCFDELYHQNGIPLETLSTWGWHSFPNVNGLRLEDSNRVYDFHGRQVAFPALQFSPAGEYFRQNPHPIPLGKLGLVYRGQPVAPQMIEQVDQQLDLWTGAVRSRYLLDGRPVSVVTAAHSHRSAVAIGIESPLLASGELEVQIRFAYSHDHRHKNRPALLWDRDDAHRTTLRQVWSQAAELQRQLDDSRYAVALRWDQAARLRQAGAHDFRLTAAEGVKELSLVASFSAEGGETAPDYAEALASSAAGWVDYWSRGGMIDLSGSSDPRAKELERRVVLSLYLARVNYSGRFPPSEAGLTYPTWYGKHNTEMFFWHAAHFYQWGRTELLEKGLGWYRQILPVAQQIARDGGFAGAQWPKMAGIDGRPTPGTINPFIIWNQPNPIYLSELVYRANPTAETLEKYREVVLESGRYLASYAFFDEATQRYVLGPPVRSVSERVAENNTQNPTFELAYWQFGLQLAQTWRERLGLGRDPQWDDIIAKLSPLTVTDGVYVDLETLPNIFREPGQVPSSMLMAYGFLPQTPLVDRETMRSTLHAISAKNGMDYWVSWATGKAAMTAARLGEPEISVTILANTKTPAARFMNNGHVRRPKEPITCPAYLPVNGSLLCAIGLMTAGWDGAPATNAPGFPREGWVVKWEGLNPMP